MFILICNITSYQLFECNIGYMFILICNITSYQLSYPVINARLNSLQLNVNFRIDGISEIAGAN